MGQVMPCLKTSQDGGDGHVGTVVEVGHVGNGLSPDKTVIVQWDNGRRTNYRVGYKGAYDLLVFDGAPSGVKHYNKRCDGCGRRGIKGIRWQCTQCEDYDLCTKCYMENVHNTQHKFRRFLTNKSTGVLIPKRAKCTRSQANGIYPGAKVIRGYDWVWGDQDGGSGSIGTVTETRGWQNESDSSVARVMWPGDRPNVYRVGHRGKVDIKYVIPGKGPMYYKDHLPVLGKDVPDPAQIPPPKPCPFSIGDRVRVSLPVEVLKPMQKGHGGWNPKMADLIGKVGVVHRITQAGDVRVQYRNASTSAQTPGSSNTAPPESNRWTLNPAALTLDREAEHFCVRDSVWVIEDRERVKSLQSSEHGNWNDKMTEVLGQKGVVVEVYRDGDIRVEFSPQRQWTFNPACLLRAPASPTPNGACVLDLFADKRAVQAATELITKANAGDLQGLKQVLHTHPSTAIDAQLKGKTALHVSAFRGHAEIVRFLLRKNASISTTDGDGDNAIFWAMSGNKDECVRLLLEHASAADVNHVNATKTSPLHFAAIKNNVEWARLILDLGCDVNLQDKDGDTAAHCCVTNLNNLDMMRLLLSKPELDPTLVNSNGFNIFHIAALKGKLAAAKTILEKFPGIALAAKTDGLTALHLSALNDHEEVTELLVNKCPPLIDQCDMEQKTPLMFAVCGGFPCIVDILVRAGARVDTLTTDGKTYLDIALEKYFRPSDDDNSSNISSAMTETSLPTTSAINQAYSLDISLPVSTEWDEIKSILGRNGLWSSENDVFLAIASFLLRNGACRSSDHGISLDAFDLATDPRVLSVLHECRKHRTMSILASEFSNQVDLSEDASSKKLMATSPGAAPKQQDKTFHVKTRHSTSRRSPPLNNFVTSLEDDELSECKTPTQECMSCADEKASVVFQPCGHKLVCLECCVRVKKCLRCHSTITAKVDENGVNLSLPPSSSMGKSMASLEQQQAVLNLERKVRELQESNQCIICMEQQRDTALKCGHRFCHECANNLRKHCPICRKPITGTIRLY